MYRKRKHVRQRLMAGATALLLMLTACAGEVTAPTPLASQAVALTSQDFAHAVNTLAAKPITTDFGLELWALRYDEEVKRHFDNGYHTWHLSPVGGNAYPSGAESWVLSFRKLEAAKRAFDMLAEPSRAGFTAEDVNPSVWTGERELPWGKIGDESRVFDHDISEILSSTERDTTTWYRVIVRKDRIVLMVQGNYPSDPAYFARLTVRMANRVP